MRKSVIVGLLFLLIFSCSKTDKKSTSNCISGYSPSSEPIICSGSICQSDTCKTYLAIWKELFLEKNQMTQEYFDQHITICNSSIYKYSDYKYTSIAISFDLAYTIRIDWFQAKLEEDFLVWISPSYLLENPNVNLPTDILLTKDQINSQINNSFFSSGIHPIHPINHLKYFLLAEAMNAMAHAAGVNSLCANSVNFTYPNPTNSDAGQPLLEANGVINLDSDKCVSCKMDLETGAISVDHYGCTPIYFCFTQGTKILQKNRRTVAIEKIRAGDTILSVNQKNLKIEEDIVKRVDSVMHNHIVKIVFDDLTENQNTFDHPYFVKHKGWCSYKPLETEQKYNIRTNQFQVGDTCLKFLDRKLIEIRVRKIIEEPGQFITYNISETIKNQCWFANGILVSAEKQSSDK